MKECGIEGKREKLPSFPLRRTTVRDKYCKTGWKPYEPVDSWNLGPVGIRMKIIVAIVAEAPLIPDPDRGSSQTTRAKHTNY